MPNFLSEADITGVQATAPAASSAPASSPYLSEAAITGIGQQVEEPSIGGFLKELGTNALSDLKKGAGLASSVAEIIGAGPGMALGEIAGQLQKTQEIFKGKSPEEASAIGTQIAQNIARGLNPVTKLKELFGYEPPQNEIDSAMTELGRGIKTWARANESEYRINGKPALPAGDYESLANYLMGLGGTKPVKAGLEAGAARIVDSQAYRSPADRKIASMSPEEIRATYEDIPSDAPTPAPDQAYRQPMAPLTPPTAEEINTRAAQRMKDLKAAVKAESATEKAARMGAQDLPQGEPATWTSGGVDFNVQVTGEPVTGPDGKRYTPVRYGQTDTFVPEQELTRAKKAEPLPTDEFMGPPRPESTEGKTPNDLRQAPPTLDTALEKVKNGQNFLLTPEEHISLQAVSKAAGSIVDEDGKPIGTAFGQDGKVDPRVLAALGITSAATWAYLHPEDQEKLASLGLVGATMLPEGRSALRPLLDKIKPYTSTLLERLPEGRTEFSRTHLEQELSRPDLSGAEKGVFQRVLGAIPGDKISAKALVDGFTEETTNWRLTPKETPQYAAYGLEGIDRIEFPDNANEGIAPPATTTLYRLPEHMQVSDANHFGDSRLFGWTRSFEENGVKHVVELQSDLAQKAKQRLSEAEYKSLSEEHKQLENNIAEMWRKIDEAPTGEVATQAHKALADYELRRNELSIKLAAHEATPELGTVSPILKNWPRRLIREELVKAGDAPVVRFATADTVAKVEGWPKKTSDGTFVVKLPEYMNEDYTGKARIKSDTAELELKDGSWESVDDPDSDASAAIARDAPKGISFVEPGHQGIYDRYAKEITRYLKGLGGKEVTDSAGHTWIETPTSAVATPRGPAVKMFGGADLKLLAALGLGAAAYAAFGDNPDVSKLSILGLAGTILTKHPETKGLPESALIDAFRKGGKEGELAATKLYADNVKQLERSLRTYNKSGVPIEDVAQEAFIRAFDALKRPGGFREEARFSTFLHVIAQRLAATKFRELKNSPVEFKDVQGTDEVAGLEETAGHEQTPELEVANKALLAKMSAALDKLPDNFRRSFEMSEFDGLPDTEIAEVLGIPVGTVKSQISRAKAQLQGSLREYKDLQAGRADPRLLAGIAVLGGGAALGAYLNPDQKVKAALYGAGIATLLMSMKPKEWGEAIKRAQTQAPIERIDGLTRDRAYTEKVAKRAVLQMQMRLAAEVPDPARRGEIYKALVNEESTDLTPREQRMADEVRTFYQQVGEAAKKAGVVKELIDDYATRIYGKPLPELGGSRQLGGNTGLDSPFGKPRQFKTMAEATAAGYVPKTTDIAEVLGIYSDSVNAAIANRNLIDALRKAKTLDGTAALVAKSDVAPKGYGFIAHPQLRGYMVHPDIMPDLKFIFSQTEVGPILGALDAINSTQKRMAVMTSLFHVTALEQAMLGGMSMLKSPALGIKAFGQSFMPAIFGEHVVMKMLREGSTGDMVDRGMKAGLEFSMDRQGGSVSTEDSMHAAYKGLDAATKYLDGAVPGLGKVSTGAVMQLNHMFDQAMWGRFHTTLKLATFADKARELSANNAREVAAGRGELKSQETLDRMASSFTNDLYGGLNWQQMVQEFSSRWGREIAGAAFGPAGRLGMRLMLFAPDWTISTTRAFTKAFGDRALAAAAGAVVGAEIDPNHKLVLGAVGALAGYGLGRAAGLKEGGGSGLRGLLQPTELADLHRQYFLRSAFIYTVLGDAVNYQMSGHHLWENKDPTRLDRGDGTTMQASKHFMEPFHWIINPKKQAMGKASFLVKETMDQLEDSEYWTPGGAPRMGQTPKGEPVTLPTRLEHAAKQFAPISAQGFDAENPTKMAWSAAGMPVYGKTYEEQAAAKAARKAAAIQRRIDRRTKESQR